MLLGLLGGSYLNAPVLPRVVVQYGPKGQKAEVQHGGLISVDDALVTVLDDSGHAHFLPVAQVRSQILCSTGPQPPASTLTVHGWSVELSALSWLAPKPLRDS